MTVRCPKCQFDNRAGATFCSRCGTPLSPRDAQGRLRPGTMLEGRYRLEQVLGAGGFGAVYLAEDTRLQRACVVKEMLVPAGASAQEVTALCRNFEREAGSLVALNHPGHPSIPEIYDFFSDPSGNYLVMKYIQGKTLEELMTRQGRNLPWRQAVKYAIAVCDALAYMHSHQRAPVLHRDIKPANILVDQAGRTWLVDFGLSKAQPVAWTGTTGGTTAAGTPGYTPLEQWMMRAVPASDVYALGATLHHLVTGRDPRQPFATTFDLARIKQEHGNFPPLRTLDAALPAELERLVAEAVKANPRQRPGASQWKQALEALVTPSKVARPFTFQSGDVARTPKDLVSLCDRYWDEARGYLHNGDFVRWFQTLNRNDLVAVAQKAVSQHNDKDAGLEAFLQSLDPSLPKPQWGVAQKALDFGSLGAHGKKALNLTIMRRGRGYARVKAETKDRWLQVAPLEVGLKSGEQATLKVEADAERMAVGTSGRGRLTLIGSDGRQRRIVAKARISTLNTLWDRHGVRISGGIIGGIAGLVVSGFLIAYCSLEVQEYVSASIGVSFFFISVGVGWILEGAEYGCLLPLMGFVLQFLLAVVLDNLVGGEPFAVLAFNSMPLAFYGSLYAPMIVEKLGDSNK